MYSDMMAILGAPSLEIVGTLQIICQVLFDT